MARAWPSPEGRWGDRVNPAAVEARIRVLEKRVEEMAALLNRVHQHVINLLATEMRRGH